MDDGTGDDSSDIHAARHWILPNEEFDGLWESLVYDDDLKPCLMRYALTTLLFADRGVDANLVTWNKVLLLHGPPGTGKTSLCTAFAQKLTIRLGSRYKYGQLIEINSHSLFSKWFSESGKLVQKMFETIRSMLDDPSALIFVLIDEVESLAAARKSVSAGSEPSDAVRVVNAMLTQLDSLRRHPNVLIFTTSNLTGTIDVAFVDRADLKRYVGLPSQAAIFQMLADSLEELQEKQLVQAPCLDADTQRLRDVCRKCEGFSGRTIRKLPFLAFAENPQDNISVAAFLDLLEAAVKNQQCDREKLEAKA